MLSSTTLRRALRPALTGLALAVPAAGQVRDAGLARADSARARCTAAAQAGRAADAAAAAETAATLYAAAAGALPRDPNPLVGQARVLSQCELPWAGAIRKGELYARSTRLLEQALALDSTHWEARYSLALNHYHAPAFLGRTAEAIRQFEILLALQGDAADFPEQAAPYAYLGDLYRRENRPADAARVWRRGAALFPRDERLRRRLGRLPSGRFDYLIRENFFAGLRGDTAAFRRAMKLTEDTLAANPRHAEALVWHGSGLLYLAGQAFAGDGAGRQGQDLWRRGLGEMDSAAAWEPDNVAVLIPRASTLLAVSRDWLAPGEARARLAQAVADYEKVLRLQAPYFQELPVHARCELLAGAAEARHRLADSLGARDYYRRIREECAGTGYASEAEAWLQGKAAAGSRTCQGCHVPR